MKKFALATGILGLSLSSFAAYNDTDNDKSPWLVRARAIWITPNASSSPITTIGGSVSEISSVVVPELDFSYFFSNNFSLELILATNRHSVTATGTSLGQTISLGKVSLLPPTITMQYHFMADKKISPYAGVGLNYTVFYDVDSGPTASSIDYKNSYNPAYQFGLDYKINENWSLNLDAKKIFVSSKVTVVASGTQVSTNVSIDPWIFGVGVGYHA